MYCFGLDAIVKFWFNYQRKILLQTNVFEMFRCRSIPTHRMTYIQMDSTCEVEPIFSFLNIRCFANIGCLKLPN